MPKRQTAKSIYQKGRMADFEPCHIVEIVENLIRKNLAEAFFIGMGWPEALHYINDRGWLEKTLATDAVRNHAECSTHNEMRAYWFACRFLD